MSVLEGPYLISVHTRFRGPAAFATDNGVGQEVTVELGNPGPRQTWFVQPTGKPDVYTITAGALPPTLDAPGFRRDVDPKSPQNVINAPPPAEWRLVPFVAGLNGVFYVELANNPAIGVEELLGGNGGKVVIQSFPTGIPSGERPAWNFNPVN